MQGWSLASQGPQDGALKRAGKPAVLTRLPTASWPLAPAPPRSLEGTQSHLHWGKKFKSSALLSNACKNQIRIKKPSNNHLLFVSV